MSGYFVLSPGYIMVNNQSLFLSSCSLVLRNYLVHCLHTNKSRVNFLKRRNLTYIKYSFCSRTEIRFFSSYLNWLLSFFWLCEEAKCIYVHLHLGGEGKFPNNTARQLSLSSLYQQGDWGSQRWSKLFKVTQLVN